MPVLPCALGVVDSAFFGPQALCCLHLPAHLMPASAMQDDPNSGRRRQIQGNWMAAGAKCSFGKLMLNN
jgi:hypothetical protein